MFVRVKLKEQEEQVKEIIMQFRQVEKLIMQSWVNKASKIR